MKQKQKKKKGTIIEEKVDLVQAERQLNNTQAKLTAATIAAPLVMSYLVKAFDIVFDKSSLAPDISLFWRFVVATILALPASGIVYYFTKKVNRLKDNVLKIKESPSQLKNQNSGLNEKNTELQRLCLFYINCSSIIRNIIHGDRTQDDIGRELAVALHSSIVKRNKGKCDDLTINIYILHDEKIRIIGNYHEGAYIDAPRLLETTLSVTDRLIANFYSVKCIKSNDSTFVLKNWKEMVENYIPDANRRIELIDDRKEAIKRGFKYNQSICFRDTIKYPGDTLSVLIELVTYNNSQFANENELEAKAIEYRKDYVEPILATIDTYYMKEKVR